jgi:hypothetical protein
MRLQSIREVRRESEKIGSALRKIPIGATRRPKNATISDKLHFRALNLPRECLAPKMPSHVGRKGLSVIQRSRDLVPGQLTLDYFIRKAAEGWSIAAVEWVREVDDTAAAKPLEVSVLHDEIPYGLRLASDGMHLEPNPLERTALLLILDKIVQEKRITQIAAELNTEGFRTREGIPWSASAVFDLLPRLIEAGPQLLKSSDWQQLREKRPVAN